MCLNVFRYFINSSSYGVSRKRNLCYLTATSPKTSRQAGSLAAGRINSSPIVKSFLALAMRLATKNDALSADIFDDVVAFNNCFCPSCPHFYFNLPPRKACFLMQGARSLCEVQFLRFRRLVGLNKAGLRHVNHL